MNYQNLDNSQQQMEIAIIGAGIAGLCMAINLKKVNITSFLILERANSLGGTWRDNTYPGAGCDVPSFLYSFSFEPKDNWTLKYPKQPEILEYLEHCTDKYGIRKHIQFNREIECAVFQPEEKIWNISTRCGQKFQAKILISACGQLNKPKIPKIPGIETFKGTQFHSANWNHQHNLTDKKVAVLGTGASAIQFIPLLAKQVKKLTIFQRSANWIINKQDHKFTPFEHWMFRTFPFTIKLYRWYDYFLLEFLLISFTLQKDSFIGKLLTNYISRQRWQKVKQTKLKSILEPKFVLGCKRILLSNDYYEAVQSSNVEIIKSQIQVINPNSIITKDGQEHFIDTLILATGFDSTNFLSSIRIIGLNNQLLKDSWQEGAEAYKGIMVSGFPNFFMLYGPNTNTSNSIIFMIECQVRYILSCLKLLPKKSLPYLDVNSHVQSQFNQELEVNSSKTVWSTNCTNWYKTDKGKIINNWPKSTIEYWLTTLRANPKDFN